MLAFTLLAQALANPEAVMRRAELNVIDKTLTWGLNKLLGRINQKLPDQEFEQDLGFTTMKIESKDVELGDFSVKSVEVDQSDDPDYDVDLTLTDLDFVGTGTLKVKAGWSSSKSDITMGPSESNSLKMSVNLISMKNGMPDFDPKVSCEADLALDIDLDPENGLVEGVLSGLSPGIVDQACEMAAEKLTELLKGAFKRLSKHMGSAARAALEKSVLGSKLGKIKLLATMMPEVAKTVKSRQLPQIPDDFNESWSNAKESMRTGVDEVKGMMSAVRDTAKGKIGSSLDDAKEEARAKISSSMDRARSMFSGRRLQDRLMLAEEM